MVRVGHPDDTDSGEEHVAAHEASRQAGPEAGTCGTEREREGEDGSALRRSRQALSDPSSSPAFAEVRALLWRREWMKSQIELLTLQREQLSQSLSRVEGEKAPILLPFAPVNKRKRGSEVSAAAVVEENETGVTPAADRDPNASGPHAADSSGKDAGERAGGGAAGGYGAVREVDWETVLGGRRRKLVQAELPLEALAALQAESKKRFRARDMGLSALRDSGFSLGKDRPKTHKEVAAARAQAVAQQQLQQQQQQEQEMLVSDVRGNVTNGGRKLVTSTGQKVIIKFTAKNPGLSPRTPTSAQLKNGRNGASTPRAAGSSETPINSQKRHRTVLNLADSKMQRAVGSPRLAPSSSHTPSHTPRDHHKQEWGLDEYVYGGPRTHTQIETVVAKEIHVPTWFVLEEEKGEKGEKGEGESSGGRLSRSLALGSKYAKPRAAPRSNGRHDGESSDELTDDEVYLARHRPYEEQEVRFRHPKQQERAANHKEALKKEGSVYSSAEDAYKSLWYRGIDRGDESSKESKVAASPVLTTSAPHSPQSMSIDKKSPVAASK